MNVMIIYYSRSGNTEKIAYPFDSGIFKKGDYNAWIKQVLNKSIEA